MTKGDPSLKCVSVSPPALDGRTVCALYPTPYYATSGLIQYYVSSYAVGSSV